MEYANAKRKRAFRIFGSLDCNLHWAGFFFLFNLVA